MSAAAPVAPPAAPAPQAMAQPPAAPAPAAPAPAAPAPAAPAPAAPAPAPKAPPPKASAPKAPPPKASAPKGGFAKGPDPNAPNQTQFFMAAAGVSTASKIKRVLIFVALAVAIGTGAIFMVRYAVNKKDAAPPAKTEPVLDEIEDPAVAPAAGASKVDEAADKAKTDEADKAKTDEAKPGAPKADSKKPS